MEVAVAQVGASTDLASPGKSWDTGDAGPLSEFLLPFPARRFVRRCPCCSVKTIPIMSAVRFYKREPFQCSNCACQITTRWPVVASMVEHVGLFGGALVALILFLTASMWFAALALIGIPVGWVFVVSKFWPLRGGGAMAGDGSVLGAK